MRNGKRSDEKDILQMAHGAIEERVDIEMARIIENVLNENTKPETKADAGSGI